MLFLAGFEDTRVRFVAIHAPADEGAALTKVLVIREADVDEAFGLERKALWAPAAPIPSDRMAEASPAAKAERASAHTRMVSGPRGRAPLTPREVGGPCAAAAVAAAKAVRALLKVRRYVPQLPRVTAIADPARDQRPAPHGV